MEESKTTSEFVYEDDYSFVTEENEIFLKGGTSHGKRKIGDVADGKVQEKIANLKEAFSDLEQELSELETQETVTEEQLSAFRSKLDKVEAVGDFAALYARLEDLENEQSGLEQAESDHEEALEKAEEEVEAETVAEEADEEKKETDEEPSIEFYEEIVDKAQDLAKQEDWPYVSMELDNLSHQWSEGPDLDTDDVGKLYKKFTKIVQDFEERKEEHYKKLKEKKQNNLQKKKKLLNDLKEIVEKKDWTATSKVGKIKGKWNSVAPLPSGESVEELEEKFNKLVETFNDHKVDRLVQKRQKEEDNLMLKLSILDKMEKVASSIDHKTENWKEIDDTFEDLTNQWKKIGRVPKEKANEVWQRYKDAQDLYYDNKYKYDPKHQSKVDRFRSKKEKLCRQAEELLEEEDLATAARKINKLHRRWKKVGNLPQRDEDELWNRFKAATDAFNERKANNSEKIRKQEEEHYQQKLELIEEAEAIKGTDDFDKGHQKMQSLMDKWKAIGPVPRKKSNKIWKQFKGAMDVFYDRRREHFKEQKKDQKKNLKKKEEILEKLRELGQHEDPIEAVNIAKKLQAEFKDIGYVPIKKKNEIWKQYREACDVIYDRMRAAKSGDKFDQELAKADLDPKQRSKIQDMRKKYKKIEKEVNQLESEKLQYEEKKTYFKPSSKGNALLDEVENKIEQVESKLNEKQEKLDTLTEKMEEIKEKE